jgi:hypothetical protein
VDASNLEVITKDLNGILGVVDQFHGGDRSIEERRGQDSLAGHELKLILELELGRLSVLGRLLEGIGWACVEQVRGGGIARFGKDGGSYRGEEGLGLEHQLRDAHDQDADDQGDRNGYDSDGMWHQQLISMFLIAKPLPGRFPRALADGLADDPLTRPDGHPLPQRGRGLDAQSTEALKLLTDACVAVAEGAKVERF